MFWAVCGLFGMTELDLITQCMPLLAARPHFIASWRCVGRAYACAGGCSYISAR